MPPKKAGDCYKAKQRSDASEIMDKCMEVHGLIAELMVANQKRQLLYKKLADFTEEMRGI